MRRTRGLWASIIFVLALTSASLVGFATGALRPILGLDLEGGSRSRFRPPTARPKRSWNALARTSRTASTRSEWGNPTSRFRDDDRGADPRARTGHDRTALTDSWASSVPTTRTSDAPRPRSRPPPPRGAHRRSQVAEACLVDGSGTGWRLSERGRREAREAGEHGGPEPDAGADDAFCLVSATGQELECFPARKEAEAARDELAVEVTEETHCVTDGAGTQEEATPTPTPTSSPTPAAGASASLSPSLSPTPAPTAFSALARGRRPPVRPPTEADAQGAVQTRRCKRSTASTA